MHSQYGGSDDTHRRQAPVSNDNPGQTSEAERVYILPLNAALRIPNSRNLTPSPSCASLHTCATIPLLEDDACVEAERGRCSHHRCWSGRAYVCQCPCNGWRKRPYRRPKVSTEVKGGYDAKSDRESQAIESPRWASGRHSTPYNRGIPGEFRPCGFGGCY